MWRSLRVLAGTHDDPSETVAQYAPDALRVNGTLQPGGS